MSAPEGYEETKWTDLRTVSARMRELPEVAAAVRERRPFALTCPRGHKIVTVLLEDDEDVFSVRPIADTGRTGGASVVADTPFRKGRTVCRAPRCPNLVDGDGWCPDHGGREALTVSELATRFTCPAASAHGGKPWSDRVTTPRLLKVLAVAAVTGAQRVPVTGHVGASRQVR